MTALRIAGQILLWFGFLAGCWVAVQRTEVAGQPWATVEWLPYICALVIGVVGAVAIRVSQKQAASETTRLGDDLQVLNRSIQSLCTKMTDLIKQRSTLHVYAVRHVIDRTLRDDIADFVDARETLIHTFSMQDYADAMTDFAIAERYVNRAWSASADGYIDEVWTCLPLAAERFTAVAQQLQQLSDTQSSE